MTCFISNVSYATSFYNKYFYHIGKFWNAATTKPRILYVWLSITVWEYNQGGVKTTIIWLYNAFNYMVIMIVVNLSLL